MIIMREMMSTTVVLFGLFSILHAQVIVPPRTTPMTLLDNKTPHNNSPKLPKLHFTEFVESDEYSCIADPAPRSDEVSMQYIYMTVNAIITTMSRPFRHEQIFTDSDLFSASSAARSLERNNAEVIDYAKWYMIVIISLVIAVAIFTFGYVMYTCCRCCCSLRHRPKGRQQKQLRVDGKYDSCRRKFYTTVLAVITMIMIMSCIGTLMSNHYIHEGVVDAPDTIRECVDDVQLYRDETLDRIDKLLITDYTELNSTLIIALDSLGVVVVDRLKEISGASAIDKLADISNTAAHLEQLLISFVDDLTSLERQVATLYANLTRLRESATVRLTDCVNTADNRLRKAYCQQALDAFGEYTNLPERLTNINEIDTMKSHLRKIQSYNASSLLADAQRQFGSLETRVVNEIRDGTEQVKLLLGRIGDDLASSASIIRSQSSSLAPPIDTYTIVSASDITDYREVEKYRYIVGYLIMLPLCAITLLLTCGVCYGCCGRRPSYYEDDCCVKSTGATVYCPALMIGVVFLLPSAVIACALFVAGVNVQWLACDAMGRPMERQDMVSFLERYREHPHFTEQFSPDVADALRNMNISELIEGCADNRTIYSMLNIESSIPSLSRIADFKLTARAEIGEQLKRVEEQVARMNAGGARDWETLLPEEVQDIIRRLDEEEVMLVPDVTIRALRRQAESLNILNATHGISEEISRRPIDDKDTEEIRYLLDEVAAIDQLTARPLRENITRLADKLDALNRDLPQLTANIPEMLASLRHAQSRLANNLTALVQTAAHEVADALLAYVDEYAEHVKGQTENEITGCHKLAQIAKTSKHAVCEGIVDPQNAYWLGMFICIILTMPAMLLVTCLRDLYRNTEAYTGIDFGLTHPASSSSASGGVTPRHRRFGAFITDTYDQSYGRRHHKVQRANSGYTQWRNGSGSSTSGPHIEEVTTPPPPYHSHYAASSSRRL